MIREFTGNVTNYFQSNESDFETSFVKSRRKLFEAESGSQLKISELHQNYKLRLRKEKIDEIIITERFKNCKYSNDTNSEQSKLKNLNEILKNDKKFIDGSETLRLIRELLNKQEQEFSREKSLDNLIFIYKYLINNLHASLTELNNIDLVNLNEENILDVILKKTEIQTLCLNDLISLNSECFEEYLTQKVVNNRMKKLKNILINFTKFELNNNKLNRYIIEIKTNCIDITSNIISIINGFIPDDILEHMILNIKQIKINEELTPSFISSVICFFNNSIKKNAHNGYKEICLEIVINILTTLRSPKIKSQCLSLLLELVRHNDFILLEIMKRDENNLIEILFYIISQNVSGSETNEHLFYTSICILNKFLISKETNQIFTLRYSITDFFINILKNVDIIHNKLVVTNSVHSLLLGFSANEVKNLKIDFVTILDHVLSLTSCRETIEDILNIYNIILDDCSVEFFEEIIECGMIKTLFNLIQNEIGFNRYDNFIVRCVLILLETFIKNDYSFKFKKKLKKLNLSDNTEYILSNISHKCKNKIIYEKVCMILRYFDK